MSTLVGMTVSLRGVDCFGEETGEVLVGVVTHIERAQLSVYVSLLDAQGHLHTTHRTDKMTFTVPEMETK